MKQKRNDKNRKGNWRFKPISEKQTMFLHDTFNKFISSLTRGEASEMIQNILDSREQKVMRFEKGNYFDRDTLEENK